MGSVVGWTVGVGVGGTAVAVGATVGVGTTVGTSVGDGGAVGVGAAGVGGASAGGGAVGVDDGGAATHPLRSDAVPPTRK